MAAAHVAGGVKDMIVGKQDTAYSGLPTVYDQFTDSWWKDGTFGTSKHGDADLRSPTATAAMAGAGDAQMGDIVQKQLGERFIRREKDANGYEIFVTRGEDGQEQKGYLNKPGLDGQDIWRGVYQTAPYLVGGFGAGAALRGTGAITRAAGQSAAAGATSISGDLVSGQMGSEQGVDFPKAAITAGTAGLAEGVAPGVQAIWRRLVSEPKLFNRQTGQLTAEGAEAAKQAGYDPTQMAAEIQREFAKTYAKTGGDTDSTIAAVSDREWGLPSTLGQRSKDPQQLLDEKAMRYGLQGQAAKETITAFDQRQADALRAATLDSSNSVTSMAQRIAPERSSGELSASSLGPEIRRGMQSAQGSAKAAADEAWDKVTDLTPKPQAFESLPDMLAGRLGDLPVDEVNTRAAASMAKALDGYVTGKAMGKPVAGVLKQTPVVTIDQMRRRLLAMSQSADNGTDRKAAQAIYDGFNDWIDDAAQKSLLNGDVEAAAALRTARDVTKTMKQTFAPSDLRGRATPGARILDDVLQRSDSAEGIVSGLFGGGPAANIPDGTIEALKLMRTGLTRYAKSHVAKQTWNDVRVAYWVRLVRDKTGAVATPGVLLRNLKLAQNNQISVIRELYTPAEQGAIMRLRMALEQISYKDPNPSGSGTAIATYAKQFMGNLLAAIPGGQLAWQYSGVPRMMGYVAAHRAVSQSPQVQNALLGPWGAAGAAGGQVGAPNEPSSRNALMPR